jgi:hypothetical protein
MGSGASAAMEAMAGASSDEIRSVFDGLSPAALEKLQKAVNPTSDVSEASLTPTENTKPDVSEVSIAISEASLIRNENTKPDVSEASIAANLTAESEDSESNISPDMNPKSDVSEASTTDACAITTAELEGLDLMEMSTLEKWAVWAEGTYLKKLQDEFEKKSRGDEIEIAMGEVCQHESWLSDTVSFIYQYLEADETTTPKPWKTVEDKAKLQTLVHRMRKAAEMANDILRQLMPDEGEVSEEEY